jgi:hypothetical protein
MDCDKIASFVKASVEALPAVPPCGIRYRVSATLIDGTLLSCVVIEPRKPFVDLAVRRFEEERSRGIAGTLGPSGGYPKIVETFVTAGNCLSHYDIGSLQLSEFAIPLARLREVRGETSAGWTEFYGAMGDGREFCFGTAFGREFFDMPPGYVATDIQKIVPATRGEKRKYEEVYRERPYFTCYIDGI